jgi:LDH2 family malate/lactate/ureidoglycolate dehydrogenase
VACVQAGHTGRIGAFTERAAREDMVAFMAIGTVGNPMTAPYGGARPILGTNPVSFAVPADRHPPVLLDYATSAIAAGKVKVAKARGQQLPPGSILDSSGQPSTDPDDLFHGGFLLPFGAHKGYALAVIAELLSGPLVGAETFPAVFQRSGIFILCMDAGAFRPAEAAVAAVDASIDKIKAVPPGPGFDEVLVPGEVEARSQQQRERDGIPIPDLTWQAVGEVAASLGLELETIARG